jgi:hypothetical protein
MNRSITRLKWEFDSKGYDLIEVAEPKPAPRRTYGQTRKWAASQTIAGTASAGLQLQPRGGAPRLYRADIRQHDIYLELVNVPPTAEGVLSFVRKRGLLTPGVTSVDDLLEEQSQMRSALKYGYAEFRRRRRGSEHIANLKVVPEREGLIGYAWNLRQFCWLEALQAMGAGDIFECANCKTWGRYTWTGRPPMYCSNKCKEATYRKRRRLQNGN